MSSHLPPLSPNSFLTVEESVDMVVSCVAAAASTTPAPSAAPGSAPAACFPSYIFNTVSIIDAHDEKDIKAPSISPIC